MKKQKVNLQQGEYIYGLHSVHSFIKSKPGDLSMIYVGERKTIPILDEILAMAKEFDINVHSVANMELDCFVHNENHQGIVAKLRVINSGVYEEKDLEPLLDSLKEPPFLLLLDCVHDPHNLGACLRTADAAGVHIVLTPKDRACGLTPAVRKVACGAAETTPFIQVTNLARTMSMLKERGIWLYGAVQDAQDSIFSAKLKGPLGIVLGSEGEGLRHLTRESCDFLISVPMLGAVSSLNVSVATGICLFEALRQSKFSIS
jgi:23S rRNA (guanosine2251-2'-O)-methyltransferase